MKKKYLLLFILMFTLVSFSQVENEKYKKVALIFESLYNQNDYESIFNMFDANMKAALPVEKTKSFFSENVNAPSGLIKKMEFYKLKQSAHIYKTTFERSTMDVLISLDSDDKINGFYISPYKPSDLPKLERNTSEVRLPFNEEWFVFWGGLTVDENYHVAYENQKYAYDLLLVKDGKSFQGDAKDNNSYFVFGKEIISPCDAKVVKVIRGVHDNIPGELNPAQLTGNTIILETKQKEYILFAHMKEKSIQVEEGQIVKTGDLLGLCGNSGNTSEPHLHLSLQNIIDMPTATGAKLYFNKILVNGKIKENYIPVKGDKIQNIK